MPQANATDRLGDLPSPVLSRYEDIDLDRLTAYGLKVLGDNDAPATFENMVVVLYRLFPEKFALIGFPEYPDAARVNRALLHCQPKYRNYIAGSARSGYYLTDSGKGAADEATTLLETGSRTESSKRRRPTVPRAVADQFMREVTDSPGFAAFKEGRPESIGRYDLLRLLHADDGIAQNELGERMKRLFEYAKQTRRVDIVDYLNWLASSFRVQ